MCLTFPRGLRQHELAEEWWTFATVLGSAARAPHRSARGARRRRATMDACWLRACEPGQVREGTGRFDCVLSASCVCGDSRLLRVRCGPQPIRTCSIN